MIQYFNNFIVIWIICGRQCQKTHTDTNTNIPICRYLGQDKFNDPYLDVYLDKDCSLGETFSVRVF